MQADASAEAMAFTDVVAPGDYEPVLAMEPLVMGSPVSALYCSLLDCTHCVGLQARG